MNSEKQTASRNGCKTVSNPIEHRSGMKAVLNKTDVFVLAFGAMIGWGWVVLSGDWIARAGTLGAVLAFLSGGLVVLFVGQVYAELSSAMPSSFGVLLFTKRAMGKNASFICTWSILLAFLGVIAFEAVALPTVFTYLFPNYLQGYLYSISGFDIYASWLAMGISSSIFIAVVNYFGVKTAAFLQTVLTIVIAVVGLTFLGGAAANGSTANMQPLFANGISGIMMVAIMTPFMYIGFDVIPQAAGEMNIPPKKIGQLLVLSVAMAVGWYTLIILCVGSSMPFSQIAGSTLATADAMSKAFGGSALASKVIVIGGIAGIITSWNAFYIGASRSIYALACEGLLPSCFAKLHPKYNTPSNAIILIAVITSFTPLLGKNMLVWLTNSGGFGTVITYVIVSISFLILRKKEPDMERPYKLKYWRLIGFGSLLLCLGMVVLYLPGTPAALSWPYEWGIIGIWSLLGVVLFIIAKSAKSTSRSS